jgi:hypothetical protein
MMAQTTMTNTIIQTTVAQDMRGRVISYFAMAYFGMLPLGSLLVGAVSTYIGAPKTILAEGIAALVIVGIFWSYLTKTADPPAAPAGTGETATNHSNSNTTITTTWKQTAKIQAPHS